jgi:DNA-binding NtrC family response regulator
MIGESPPVQRIYRMIERVADTDSTVLITGESGTGKELVARTVHFNSPRRDRAMVAINCGAIPEHLLESELFGHEKGSFTGASATRVGRIEAAHGGTLFLDEVGEMHPSLQVKLLRALQEREFERVGGNRTIRVDVRIIAATNQNLEQLVRDKKFREDLYYRLNVIPIEVPALRDRIEDLPVLVEIFLAECARQHKTRRRMSPAALALLQRYPWPGNVRELKNLVERLAIMGRSELIDVADLPALYNPGAPGGVASIENGLFAIDSLAKAKRAFEQAYLQHKLSQHGYDLAETARAIGVQTAELGKLVKNLG